MQGRHLLAITKHISYSPEERVIEHATHVILILLNIINLVAVNFAYCKYSSFFRKSTPEVLLNVLCIAQPQAINLIVLDEILDPL